MGGSVKKKMAGGGPIKPKTGAPYLTNAQKASQQAQTLYTPSPKSNMNRAPKKQNGGAIDQMRYNHLIKKYNKNSDKHAGYVEESYKPMYDSRNYDNLESKDYKNMVKSYHKASGKNSKAADKMRDAESKIKELATKYNKQMGGMIPTKPIATSPIQGRTGRRGAAGSNMAKGGSLKSVNPGANPGLAKLPTPVRNKMGYAKKGGAHPGFKAVQAKIAAKSGVSKAAAGAILAASTRKASAKAKAANPRLKRVKK
jgi:hypothetical protein